MTPKGLGPFYLALAFITALYVAFNLALAVWS
jgi:hypothetical protein